MRTTVLHPLCLVSSSALALFALASAVSQESEDRLERARAAGVAEPSPTGLPAVDYVRFEVGEEDLAEATGLVGRVLTYTAANHPDHVSARAFRNERDGRPNLHLFFEHPTLLDFRLANAKRRDDEGWHALWGELTGTFAVSERHLMVPVGGNPMPAGPRRVHRMTRSGFAALPGACAFAREVAEHVGATYGIRVAVYADPEGEPGVLHWFEEYDLLIHVKAVRAKLLEDERYAELFGRAEDLFLEDDYSEELLVEIW